MKKLILILSLFAITFNVFAASKITHKTIKHDECLTKLVSEDKKVSFKDKNERIITKDKPIYFIFPDLTKDTKIIFTETRRKTKLSGDFKKVVDFVTDQIATLSKEQQCALDSYAEYKPLYKRSNLKVDTIDNKNNIIKTKTFILGPEEHFYLSADLVLTDIKQLKRNADGTLEEKEKPASFYLGLNYKIGDVLTDSSDSWLDADNISLKLMVKASDKPAKSLGFGIGYETRIGNFFVANLWTKDDNNVGSNLGTTQSVAFGISFDIGKGISWLKQ